MECPQFSVLSYAQAAGCDFKEGGKCFDALLEMGEASTRGEECKAWNNLLESDCLKNCPKVWDAVAESGYVSKISLWHERS